MNKEKKEKLVKYQQVLRNRLSDPVPPKHQGHPEQLKNYLTRELKIVSDQLEAERLDGVK